MEKLVCKMCGSSDITVKNNLIVCNVCSAQFSDDKGAVEALKANRDKSLVADRVLDFAVSESETDSLFTHWLMSGDCTPDDILYKVQSKEIKRLFIPTYLFNGKYSADWSASSGYKHKEQKREWDNAKNQYVNRTYTVTDWSPSMGTVSDSFSELVIANSDVDNELAMGICKHSEFNADELTKFDYFDTQDCELLPYAVSEGNAFDVATKNIEKRVEKQVRAQVPGDTYKDLNWSTDTSYDSCRIYYPVYVGSYEYEGEHYEYIIDGKNKNVFGRRPIDKSRQEKMNSKFVALYLCVVISIILPFIVMLNSTDVGDTAFVSSLIMSGSGMAVSIILYFIGKASIINISETSIIKRTRMLDVMENETMTDMAKEKILKGYIDGTIKIEPTAEEKQEAKKLRSNDDDNDSIDNILESKRLMLGVQVFFSIIGIVVSAFLSVLL